MPYINHTAFDQGLNYLDTNGTRLDICDVEPTTYAQATSTNSLGNKSGVNTSAPQAGDVDGRKVVVPAITDGNVTSTGTAAFWALTDGAGVLLASGALGASQGVTVGNIFTTDAININLRDAVAA